MATSSRTCVGALLGAGIALLALPGCGGSASTRPAAPSTIVTTPRSSSSVPAAAVDEPGARSSRSVATAAVPASTASTTPTTSATGPRVVAIDVPATFQCPSTTTTSGPEPTLTMRWATANTDKVTVAIDDPFAATFTDLPPNGSQVVPAPCKPNSHTYYVIAIAPDGTSKIDSATTVGV